MIGVEHWIESVLLQHRPKVSICPSHVATYGVDGFSHLDREEWLRVLDYRLECPVGLLLGKAVEQWMRLLADKDKVQLSCNVHDIAHRPFRMRAAKDKGQAEH
jgi:hypothetical protein